MKYVEIRAVDVEILALGLPEENVAGKQDAAVFIRV